MTYEVLNLFTIYLFNSEQLSIVVEASRLKVTIDADAFSHCFTNEVCVNTPGCLVRIFPWTEVLNHKYLQ